MRIYGKLSSRRVKEHIATQANSEESLRAMEQVKIIAEAKGVRQKKSPERRPICVFS